MKEKAHEIATDEKIIDYAEGLGFRFVDDPTEGRLMLLELLSKAGAGYRNSHTEEGFLKGFGLMRRDRTPNKKGLRFISAMIYASSNVRPECFGAMQLYRCPQPLINR